jgi:phosphatidylserine decarboxylase
VTKGEEKGMFEFGGSTIILLLEADKVNVCADLIEATKKGFETKLRMGEIIGKSACRGR